MPKALCISTCTSARHRISHSLDSIGKYCPGSGTRAQNSKEPTCGSRLRNWSIPRWAERSTVLGEGEEDRAMHRNVFVFVALMAVYPALIGQTRPQDRPWAPVSPQQQQAPAQPLRRRHQESDQRAPAAQYSPLAARGGYTHGSTSPLEALVHALNPRD